MPQPLEGSCLPLPLEPEEEGARAPGSLLRQMQQAPGSSPLTLPHCHIYNPVQGAGSPEEVEPPAKPPAEPCAGFLGEGPAPVPPWLV